jgi:hypothetical protein
MAKAVPIFKLTDTEGPLRASAPVLMVRLQEMLDLALSVNDPANVIPLHDMRIAAKRLRYTLELFTPVMNPGADKLLAVIEEVQERIGSIHDCDVLFPLLQDTIEQETERERKEAKRRNAAGPPPFLAAEGLAALITRKREERSRLYREFLAFWEALPPERLAADLSELIAFEAPAEEGIEAPPPILPPPPSTKRSRSKSE